MANNRRIKINNCGQTLVTLLFVMIVGIAVTSTTAVIILVNSKGASKFEQGTNSLIAAESGVENAIINLLRDLNYSGETMNVGEATVIIEVTGTNPKTINSYANVASTRREIQAEVEINNNTLQLLSWQEVF